MKNLAAVRVKSNAKYVCLECGATELIQAHHETPGDDSRLVALCASCHSRRHLNLAKSLFFNKTHQPYWYNKSAASLAKELGVSSRTIIRAARQLNIPRGELKPWDEELIKKDIPKLNPKPIKISRTTLLLPRRAASYLGITIQDFNSLCRLIDIPRVRFKRRRGNQEYFIEYFKKDILTWHLVFSSVQFYLRKRENQFGGIVFIPKSEVERLKNKKARE